MRCLCALADDTYLQTADRIRGYLKNFLTSPVGAFYTSQDADLIDGRHGGEYFQLGDQRATEEGDTADRYAYLRARERLGDKRARGTLCRFRGTGMP